MRSLVKLIELGLGICCALLLAGMTGLTVVDVVGRYWFNAPVRGAFEVTQLMLGALVFSALPLTTSRREHVEVDMIYGMVPPVMQSLMTAISGFVSTVVLFVLSWRLAAHAVRLMEDGSVTNALDIPLAPLSWIAAASALLSGAYTLVLFRKAFRRGF
ncbi:TRAP transporter small permease [Pseudovibrio sp. Tun.PSC04-5.I4]|uniref:TRAP transporter small permease n=1 Tax=Pseudovibrio sp. Tun.PSC04-5.I4 TaxID=1798213 RepID=UPI000890361B|nr:TRAP transporter small permease [Pseudovibrio sp. Tun.PSC04-5.I4]SDQ23307.1 TRAP-type C4-dicarboxylate transport system, small permease component [Pseudovibrio sp. Tun.PSC04-5.I4]